jgi:small subunit ribosomal protein S3
MGQKVHPHGLRLGIIRTWESRWFAEKDYSRLLHEDMRIRKFLKRKLYHAGISRIEIERAASKLKISIWTARPGIVIGKKGAEIENLKKELGQYTTKDVFINIQEVRKAEVNAQLVAESVATQLERRVAFRRAMKKAVTSAMKLGAKGIRIHSAGRLGGAEMSRKEWYREGRVPLHTLRADIDYGFAEASTTYGKIGVKVWIFHGEILPESKGRVEAREAARDGRDRDRGRGDREHRGRETTSAPAGD